MQEDHIIANGKQRLGATLIRPDGAGPVPALLFLSGSGPNNRWSETYDFPFFGELAAGLVAAGYAVLTFDKRGIGQSNGNYEEAGYEDRTSDALAALQWLAAQPGIDAGRLGLLGHSEGCYVAAIAATRSPLVTYMVWLAPAAESVPAQTVSEIRNNGRLRGNSARKIAQAVRRNRLRHYLLWLARYSGLGWPVVRLARRRWPASKLARFSRRWYLIFDFNPRPYLRRLEIPILALFGGLDSVVSPEPNSRMLWQALPPAGRAQLTSHIIPGANHLFWPAVTGGTREWAMLEKRFSPDLLPLICHWLSEQVVDHS